jgi:hypothetical protein
MTTRDDLIVLLLLIAILVFVMLIAFGVMPT